jgi:predicted translin family RNA/ssDNA-binding protein
MRFMKFQLPTKTYQQFEQDRRKALSLSDQLRIESKSAIGFLLKDMINEAGQSILTAKYIYADLCKLLKANPFLHSVGGVDVGTEEYVEARLLADYIGKKSLSTLDQLKVNHESYICGLCDMSGELLRYARKYPSKMKQIHEDLETLHQECLQVIITRNNAVRRKLEDLERNMLRMEEMIFQYDLKNS